MAIITILAQGGGTHKEGTILVQAPKAAGTGWFNDSNYQIRDHAIAGVGTGAIDIKYSGYFDDPRYYQGDSAS